MMESDIQPILVQPTGYQGFCGQVSDKLKAKAVLILGVIQIVIGLLCIGVNIAELYVLANLAFISQGIWCGFLFIISGIFGIAAATRKTLCWSVICTVSAILATLLCIAMLVIESIATSTEDSNISVYDYVDTDCCPYGLYIMTTTLPSCCYPGFHSSRYTPLRKSLHGVGMFLAVVEGILAIATTTLCCNAVFCHSDQQYMVHQGNTAPTLHHRRQVYLNQGAPSYQQGVYPQSLMYNTQATGPQVPVQNYPQYQPPLEPVAPPVYDSEPEGKDTQPPAYESVVDGKSA